MARAIYIAENTTPADVRPPAIGSSWIETPITQESVKPSSSSTESAIIRADRQPQDQIRTGFEVGGSMPSEMLYGGFDHLLPAALGSADFATVAAGTTGSMTITVSAWDSVARTATVTAASGAPFNGASVGDWFRIEDPDEPNDGIVCRVAAATSDTVVNVDSPTGVMANDAGGAGTATIRFGTRIVGGSTKRRFTYVKEFTDGAGTDRYEMILDLLIGAWNLSLSPNSIVTTSFDFVGKKVVPDFDGTVRIDADGNVVASGGTEFVLTGLAAGATGAPSNRVYNAISNATIVLDGILSTVMTNLQFTLNNNVEGEAVVGTQGNAFVELGNLNFGGTVEAIVEDTTLYEKFINDEQASIALYMNDSDDQGYLIDLPAVSINDGGTSIPGQTGSIKLPIQFGAGVDSVTGRAIQIVKF